MAQEPTPQELETPPTAVEVAQLITVLNNAGSELAPQLLTARRLAYFFDKTNTLNAKAAAATHEDRETKYEYRVIPTHYIAEEITKQAREGWRLVAAIGNPFVLIFERLRAVCHLCEERYEYFEHHECAACKRYLCEACWGNDHADTICESCALRGEEPKIEWKPGAYYRDQVGAWWCCIDLSNSHGLSYRLALVKDPGGVRVRDERIEWFDPSGAWLDSGAAGLLRIVKGPYPHPHLKEWEQKA